MCGSTLKYPFMCVSAKSVKQHDTNNVERVKRVSVICEHSGF